MSVFSVRTCSSGLHSRVSPPGDKSISHRALLLAARAEGESVISGLSSGDDVQRTKLAIADLGAQVEDVGNDVRVLGGRQRFHEPSHVIDVGNSGTALRLLAGYCAAFEWSTTFSGDDSICKRPMDRIAEPLRRMGATVSGTGDSEFPPLTITGGNLKGIEYTLPVASAQVKGAILLAGISADGETKVHETIRTRAHSEEMLAMFGADISVENEGRTVVVRGCDLSPRDVNVPGDPSQAAFWAVAGAIAPGSELLIENVYLGWGRCGFVDVLKRMGADIELEHSGDGIGSLRVRHSDLNATEVSGDEVPGLIDEIPILAVAATRAAGTTVFRDASELKFKETNRIATITSELSALGADIEGTDDGLVVTGGKRLQGDVVNSHGDHRIAMALAVAGLVAAGETHIEGWDAVATSYPGFVDDLETLTT